MANLNRVEQNLLMYLESCAVDKAGLFATARLNSAEFQILDRWEADGYARYGRVAFRCIQRGPAPSTHWFELSEEAWLDAHRSRRERADRCRKKDVERIGWTEEWVKNHLLALEMTVDGERTGLFHFTWNGRRHPCCETCAGHATADKAVDCYRQYLVARRHTWEDANHMSKCRECGGWTQSLVQLGAYTIFPLCPAHQTDEIILKHWPRATEFWES